MTKYIFDLCENCKNGTCINEEYDIFCKSKNKIMKRAEKIRHCKKYDPTNQKYEM